ncbi:GNAT family N-acetyltransferase [Kribbella catacumbae]|uniref:GNAT family N-acetyltransferase n=1 Tax=Kribbella catacumbae TaxID=460086 RepID=UPI003B50C22F
MRHQYNEQTGHIGYGIRPSARDQGLATWVLAQILLEARALHLDRVMLVCAADNPASAKTIEHNGGVLEEAGQPDHSSVLRYWIQLSS